MKVKRIAAAEHPELRKQLQIHLRLASLTPDYTLTTHEYQKKKEKKYYTLTRPMPPRSRAILAAQTFLVGQEISGCRPYGRLLLVRRRLTIGARTPRQYSTLRQASTPS